MRIQMETTVLDTTNAGSAKEHSEQAKSYNQATSVPLAEPSSPSLLTSASLLKASHPPLERADEANAENTKAENLAATEAEPVVAWMMQGEEEDINDYCEGGYHPLKVGDVLKQGRYVIKRKLGWGYFSTVWLARDTHANDYVAVKVVRAAQNYTETAIDETKLLKRINSADPSHPGRKHIVSLLDQFMHVGPNGVHVCMVFEVLGENLLSLMRRYHYRGIPAALVNQITVQVMLALDYLHRKCGVIHTDLKPENVLIKINDMESIMSEIELGEDDPQPTQNDATAGPDDGNRFPDSGSHKTSGGVAAPNIPKGGGSLGAENSPVQCNNRELKSNKQSFITDSKPLPSPLKRPKSKASHSSIKSDSSSFHIITPQQSPQPCDDSPTSDRGVFDDASKIATTTTGRARAGTVNNEDGIPVDHDDEGDETDEDVGFTALEDQRITVKVADFGNACCVDRHFTYDIQTRQYRAPEVLLGAQWGASVDCWSLACMIFELLTGDFLFDPQSSSTYSKDEDHVAQIVELLGPPPAYIMSGRYVSNIFDSHGRLRNIHKLKVWPLIDVFLGKYGIEQTRAEELSELLLQLLELDPRKRTDCGMLLLTNRFLKPLAQPFYTQLADRGAQTSEIAIPGWSHEIARPPEDLEADLMDSEAELRSMWISGDTR